MKILITLWPFVRELGHIDDTRESLPLNFSFLRKKVSNISSNERLYHYTL